MLELVLYWSFDIFDDVSEYKQTKNYCVKPPFEVVIKSIDTVIM